MKKKFIAAFALILVLVLTLAPFASAEAGPKPNKPTNLASTTSDAGVTLTWTDNSTIEDAYLIYRKLSTESSWTYIGATDANVTTYVDTDVVKGNTYEYKVKASNILISGGDLRIYTSDDSNIVSVFVPLTLIIIPPIVIGTAPAAPTNLSLPAGYTAKPDAVSLTWTDNANDEAGFIIERRLPGSFWLELDRVTANVQMYVDDSVAANTAYEYRVCAYKYALLSNILKSDYTNVLTVTTAAAPVETPGNYPGASSWAVAEIDKAVKAGLTTPDILSSFQKSITREEFCEIVVKLYEALSGKTAVPVNPNPFTDTSNPEILKAYNLGIVNGIGGGKFAPNNNVTRQEICVMLLRCIKVVHPGADYSTVGVGPFSDENLIASWAIDAVRYMNKVGIMKGVGGGAIDPLGNTTREQAILLVYRTYEAN